MIPVFIQKSVIFHMQFDMMIKKAHANDKQVKVYLGLTGEYHCFFFFFFKNVFKNTKNQENNLFKQNAFQSLIFD